MSMSRRNNNPKVFMDISIGGSAAGRLEFELYAAQAPLAATNFQKLCEGYGRLGYRNSRFHRIIPGFMCQGGDFTNGDGTGGESIYGRSRAAREGSTDQWCYKHDGAGVLSSAGVGRDAATTSLFFITTAPAPWLDGRHLVFGRLLQGFDVLKRIEACGSQRSGKPTQDVRIVACGSLLT